MTYIKKVKTEPDAPASAASHRGSSSSASNKRSSSSRDTAPTSATHKSHKTHERATPNSSVKAQSSATVSVKHESKSSAKPKQTLKSDSKKSSISNSLAKPTSSSQKRTSTVSPAKSLNLPVEANSPGLPHAALHECDKCLHGFTSLHRLAHHQAKKCISLQHEASEASDDKRKRHSIDSQLANSTSHSRRSSLSHNGPSSQHNNSNNNLLAPPTAGTSQHRSSLTPSVTSTHASVAGDEFVCLANNALSFKLIHALSDTQTEFNTFHPSFTHQLFADEEICGYKRCEVQMLFAASTLYAYLHMRFDECLPLEQRDDVHEIITSKLPKHSYTTQLHTFTQHIAEARQFTPPGKLIHSYDVPSVTSQSKDLITYEVYIGRFDDAAVKAYHARLQFFLLFFIDRSSYINDEDHVWEVVFVFQKKRTLLHSSSRRESTASQPQLNNSSSSSSLNVSAPEESVSWSICGYTTLYKFLCYQPGQSASWRLRLSQILLLPPYQRQGHGQHLLQLVYRLCRERECVELNIEDPSPVFQLVRDLLDVRSCREHGFYALSAKKTAQLQLQLNASTSSNTSAAESLNSNSTGDDVNSWLNGWDPVYGARVRSCLRITLGQVRRCYEILKLSTINVKDDRVYTPYRLEIKRRLYIENEDELSVNYASAAERKQQLQEMYAALEAHYLMVIRKARVH